MMDHAGVYALCWSQRTNELAIAPLADVLSMNRADYTEDKAGDFRPLMVGDSVELKRAADAMRPTMKARHVNLPLGVHT